MSWKYNFNPHHTRHKKDRLKNRDIPVGIAEVDESRLNPECYYAYVNYEICLDKTKFQLEICAPFQNHISKCEMERGIYAKSVEMAIKKLSQVNF
jgi:hypothetical protein